MAGNSSLGPFTYRGLWADDPGSQSSGSCGNGFGPNFRIVAGAGVFRFEDGSLLTVQLTEGTLCVDIADPARPVGRQFETYQITGRTGRFRHAAASCGVTAEDCTLQLTATRGLLLRKWGEGSRHWMNTSSVPRNTIERTPSHFGSYRKPPSGWRSSASFASIRPRAATRRNRWVHSRCSPSPFVTVIDARTR